jgi:PKD repeat protein
MSALMIGGIAAGAAGAAVATAVVVKNRNQPPTVSAVTASPSTGLMGATTISFSAQASDPDNNTLTYAWDFGDGGTSTATTPTYTYNTAGNFTAKVTVNDGKASVSNQTAVTIRSLTGTWRSNAVGYSQGTIQFTLTLAQSGTTVTGSVVGTHVSGPAGTNAGPILVGSVKTATPRVTVTTSLSGWDGGNMTFAVDPSSDANSLTGTVSDTTGSGSITLGRQ